MGDPRGRPKQTLAQCRAYATKGGYLGVELEHLNTRNPSGEIHVSSTDVPDLSAPIGEVIPEIKHIKLGVPIPVKRGQTVNNFSQG